MSLFTHNYLDLLKLSCSRKKSLIQLGNIKNVHGTWIYKIQWFGCFFKIQDGPVIMFLFKYIYGFTLIQNLDYYCHLYILLDIYNVSLTKQKTCRVDKEGSTRAYMFWTNWIYCLFLYFKLYSSVFYIIFYLEKY